METEKTDFDAFWLEYVREHSHPLNRKLHMIGMSLALACLVAGIFQATALAPALGAGLRVWVRVVRPFLRREEHTEEFLYPLYSLRASAILYWKTLCGEMEAEVERARQADVPAEPRQEVAAGAEVN